MVRFIHSADWQLGARFQQFGARADALRAARLTTLRRTLEVARDEAVDAFLIAGDLFEDNQVHDQIVKDTLDLFRAFPSVPVYILPGNHDPFTGPDSVWARRAFASPPDHLRVLTEPGATLIGQGVHLLASPLSQKVSTQDPSLPLVALSSALPPDAIRLGITHGALAIEGKHQPNDFPIALDAASRAGLDYLAVGHWHNWLAETDGGRLVMPGTPEPDRFSSSRAGQVALVEIAARDEPPRVKPLPVATLDWRTLSFDFSSVEASRAALEQVLAGLRPNAAHTVLRITLTGSTAPSEKLALEAWLKEALTPFLVAQLIDESRFALGAEELCELKARHPILAHVFADLDRLEDSSAEMRNLLAAARLDPAALPPGFCDRVRQITLQTLQEVID